MKRKFLLAGLLSLVATLLLPSSVSAISVPDSGPFILQVDVYRHLQEDDDMLILGRYNWPYDVGPPDTIPTETIAQSVFTRLMNGIVEVTNGVVYSYHRRGWGYGSFSMYLSATDAAGLWGTGLTVELRGSPTLTWTGGGGTPVASTPTLGWHATANNTATQALLYANLMAWASTLGDYWDVALITPQAGNDTLSSYGEAYFPNAIPNLRTFVPSLFSGAIETPQYDDIDYSTAGSEAAKAVWPFDFSGLSVYFGLPATDEVLRTIIAFIIIFTVCAVMVRYNVPPSWAMFAGFAMMFALAVPGMISLVIVGGTVFVIVLLFGAVFLLRRT